MCFLCWEQVRNRRIIILMQQLHRSFTSSGRLLQKTIKLDHELIFHHVILSRRIYPKNNLATIYFETAFDFKKEHKTFHCGLLVRLPVLSYLCRQRALPLQLYGAANWGT